MSELFLKIINMSISASGLVLVVLAFRFLFRKAPKWVNVLLWGIVAVRLICPFAIESSVSLVPDSVGNGELVSEWADGYIDDIDIHHPGSVYYDAAVGAGREPISDGEGGYYVVTKHDQLGEPDTIENTVIPILSVIWVSGVILLAIYTAVSYWRLQRRVSEAVILRENIFQSENVGSPFVLGIIKPRIYLPYHMDQETLHHVIAHEQAHIRRRDHWWKPLGFLLLTIHWFNPIMWLAYVLLCRDIELACDEKVIKEMVSEQRADYTQALVSCSVNHRHIAACPLAFGEVGVKERVKSVMNYRRPAFWVIVLSIVACAVVAVCFLTDPAAEREFPINGSNVSELDAALVAEKIAKAENVADGSQLYVNGDNFDLMFTPDFNWANDGAIRFFYMKNQKTYEAQLRMFHDDNKYFITDSSEWPEQKQIFLLIHYLEALKYMPQDAIRTLSPDADGYSVIQVHDGTPSDYDRVLEYSQSGVGDIDGWNIHLTVQPLHKAADGGYHGRGEEVIHLFYDSQNPESESNNIINPGNIKSVTVDKVQVSDEAASELISLINSHSCTSFQVGTDDPNSLSRAIRLNCSNCDFYLLHYQYYKDSYRSILTFFPMEGKCETWKMESDFDSKLSDWLAQYAFPHFGDFALNQPYGVVEVTYGNPLLSFHMVPQENSPEYMIDEAGQLFSVGEHSDAARWTKLGALQEVSITKENFDELIFSDSGLGWTDHTSASEIRKNTFKAWSVIYDQDTLYYILQQYNGELYLASGYYDHAEKDDPHSDDTNIQWILKIAPDDTPIVPDTRTLDAAIRTAIIEVNTRPDSSYDLCRCASFVLLGKEGFSSTRVVGSTDHIGVVTVYGLALYQGYDFGDNKLHVVEDSHTPVAITFHVKNGKYSLKEYWQPGDGSYYVPDIRDKFPDEIEEEALDTKKYIDVQLQECYAQAEEWRNSL